MVLYLGEGDQEGVHWGLNNFTSGRIEGRIEIHGLGSRGMWYYIICCLYPP